MFQAVAVLWGLVNEARIRSLRTPGWQSLQDEASSQYQHVCMEETLRQPGERVVRGEQNT